MLNVLRNKDLCHTQMVDLRISTNVREKVHSLCIRAIYRRFNFLYGMVALTGCRPEGINSPCEKNVNTF